MSQDTLDLVVRLGAGVFKEGQWVFELVCRWVIRLRAVHFHKSEKVKQLLDLCYFIEVAYVLKSYYTG